MKKEKKIIFCFDLDNTICKTKKSDYLSSKPKKNVIKLINKLYDQGHTIKINTARYMGRNNDDIRFENNNSKKRRKIKRFETFIINNNIKIHNATVTFLPYIYKYEKENDFNNFTIPIYLTPEKPDGIVRIK